MIGAADSPDQIGKGKDRDENEKEPFRYTIWLFNLFLSLQTFNAGHHMAGLLAYQPNPAMTA